MGHSHLCPSPPPTCSLPCVAMSLHGYQGSTGSRGSFVWGSGDMLVTSVHNCFLFSCEHACRHLWDEWPPVRHQCKHAGLKCVFVFESSSPTHLRLPRLGTNCSPRSLQASWLRAQESLCELCGPRSTWPYSALNSNMQWTCSQPAQQRRNSYYGLYPDKGLNSLGPGALDRRLQRKKSVSDVGSSLPGHAVLREQWAVPCPCKEEA